MFKFLKKSDEAPVAAAVSSKPGLIGLDIGMQCLHLCQLSAKRDGCFSIVAKVTRQFSETREALLANPARLKKMINSALRSKPFRGRKVVALMPWSEVKIILLTYKANIADVDAEILKLIGKRVEGDIGDYVIDYLPVRSNPTDDEHMAAVSVASREKVMSLLQTLNQCGLEVDALDIAPAALRRLVGTLYSEPGTDNVLLINAGVEKSFLTIVSGRRLLFYQQIEFGEKRLIKKVADELDIDRQSALNLINKNGIGKTSLAFSANKRSQVSSTLAEILKPCFLDLIEEINRVLIFTASETHGAPLSRVCLLGSIAHWEGVENLLMSMMNIDASADSTDFWKVFQDGNDHTTISWSSLFPQLAIATGLALRGMVDHE